MADLIIVEQATKEVLKRIHSPQLTIFNPESGDKRVEFVNAQVSYYDGEFQGEKPLHILEKIITEDVMMEDITYTNPLTQQEETVKVAQIMAMVAQTYVKWFNEATQEDLKPLRGNPRRPL